MGQNQIKEPHKIFLQTLGNKIRWQIAHLLMEESCRSTEIAKKLGYEQSLVSHHLRRLENCGFVMVRKNGLERIYQINKKTIKPLLKLVDNHINKFCRKCAAGNFL